MRALGHESRLRTFLRFFVSATALAVLALVLTTAAPADAKNKQKGGACAYSQAEPAELSYDQASESIRCLINKRRAKAGMGGLAANGKLNDAAQKHTDFMVDHGCFAHDCSGEATMVLRIKSTGYLDGAMAWSVGENIAWGEEHLGSPASVVDAWMNSPGHRANILNKNFDDIGIASWAAPPRTPVTTTPPSTRPTSASVTAERPRRRPRVQTYNRPSAGVV